MTNIINPYRFAVGGGSYTTTANDYDGTNDYALRGGGLTGATDTKEFTLSTWLRLDGGDATVMRIFESNNSSSPSLRRIASGILLFDGRSSAGGFILEIRGTTALTVASPGGFIHFCASGDLAVPKTSLFVNDADDKASAVETLDGIVDWTRTEWTFGAGNGATNKFNGCISEFWFDNTYLDISVTANRRKFIDASGKPVDLGSDGSTPTGAAPLIYVPDGDPSTNAGAGGNFTNQSTLTACSSSPSD